MGSGQREEHSQALSVTSLCPTNQNKKGAGLKIAKHSMSNIAEEKLVLADADNLGIIRDIMINI